MTRIVIGAALSTALLATAACSGSSPSSPSASPTATAFAAQTKSTSSMLSGSGSAQSAVLSTHDHEGPDGHGDNNGRGHEDQLEGVIASIDAVHKTFMVGTTTVTVSDTTTIRHGHTTMLFADLKVGDQVHVKGTLTGTTLAASEVKVQNEGDNDGEHGDDNEAEAQGVVSGLGGTCPSVTFTVGTTHVATNATTTFGHSTCADVINGASVEVTGVTQTDGSILASRVSVEKGDD